jgi:hypothetical protein
MRIEELKPGNVSHLRGKIDVEVEDRKYGLDIKEDEDTVQTFRHLHRCLKTNSDDWKLVNARGDLVPDGSRLIPGKRYYMVRSSDGPTWRPNPAAIQVRYSARNIFVPIFRDESLEQVLLAIALALDLKAEWGIRGHYARVFTTKEQLVHKETYYVQSKLKLSPLSKLVRRDDKKMCLERLHQ